VSPKAIHALGATLFVAWVSHAVALRGDTIEGAGWLVGAVVMMLVTVVASIWTIVTFF
jgi:uncharacterized membrane protein YecN with MAPEG domain